MRKARQMFHFHPDALGSRGLSRGHRSIGGHKLYYIAKRFRISIGTGIQRLNFFCLEKLFVRIITKNRQDLGTRTMVRPAFARER
jgi:hypothetical protein